MFPYYGSKWTLAGHSAKPAHDTIVEPFAGSAGYSTRHGEGKKCLLLDLDENIVRTWDFLLHTSASEVLSLPDLEVGQHVDTLQIPDEAKLLVGWWLNRGSSQPKKTRTAYSARNDRAQLNWCERARHRIATQLPAIARWTIQQANYGNAPDIEATWSIDPPYRGRPGSFYRHSDIDYAALRRKAVGEKRWRGFGLTM